MLGSILTRQYRFATRGVQFTVHVAQQAIDVAGDVVGAVAGRLGLGDGDTGPEVVDGEFVPEPPVQRPAATPTPPEATSTAPGPTRMPPGSAASRRVSTRPKAPPAPAAPRAAQSSGAEAPPTSQPSAPPPTSQPPAPPPTSEPPPAQPVAETFGGEPATPISTEPVHVSEGAELVEEVAEPGAEEGAGATIHVLEPWPDYRHLKARDVIARMTTATREELAAVELYEVAHANRKSVVVAAQRALKKASPPR